MYLCEQSCSETFHFIRSLPRPVCLLLPRYHSCKPYLGQMETFLTVSQLMTQPLSLLLFETDISSSGGQTKRRRAAKSQKNLLLFAFPFVCRNNSNL